MDQPGRLGHRSRWLASGGALLVAGAVLAGTVMASAAAPALPKRTPAQLLAAMRHATLPSAMTAVITQSANLGFPALPDIPGLSSSTLSAASLITGTHTADIWYAGPRHVRIALPVSFGETDLRVNGHQVWLWDSHSQTATRYIFPATFAPPPGLPAFGPAVFCARAHGLQLPRAVLRARLHTMPAPLRRAVLRALRARAHGIPLRLAVLCAREHKVLMGKPVTGTKPGTTSQGTASVPPVAELTPLQAAERLLAAVGPTTKVTVPGTVTVAGRSAYQLSIAPRSSGSLIGQILIAVDAKTYLPLQLQVFARGSSSPAFQIGFTSLTIGQPAASNFTFTPPPGAKVKTVRLPSTLPAVGLPGVLPGLGMPGGIASMGPGGLPSVFVVPAPAGLPGKAIRAQLRHLRLPRHLPGLSAPALARMRAALRKAMTQEAIRNAGSYPISGAGLGPRVLGSGWLSVAVIPAGPAMAAVVPGSGWHAHTSASSSASGPRGLAESAASQSVVVVRQGPPSPLVALLHTLLNAATRVHGSWGSGRLLRTSLFSVLITSKGDVLIGAVTPSVLYADAAKVK